MKLAIIGCGNIAKVHAPCMQKASKEIIKEGHRDNLMFAFAMFKIKKDGSVTLKDLQNYNQKRYAVPLDNQDLKRILKPGGLNLIMTPSWVHNSWGPFYVDHTHIRPFTKKSLSDAMKMSGFKEVRVNYFYQLPILWKYPFLEIFSKITASLPIKYRPFDDSILPETLNTYVRFSNEVMSIGIGKK